MHDDIDDLQSCLSILSSIEIIYAFLHAKTLAGIMSHCVAIFVTVPVLPGVGWSDLSLAM